MSEQRSVRKNYRCMVDVLTPVHIGNGEKLQQDMDFFCAGKFIHVLNRQRLFNEIQKLGKSGIAEFTSAIEDGKLSVGSLFIIRSIPPVFSE